MQLNLDPETGPEFDSVEPDEQHGPVTVLMPDERPEEPIAFPDSVRNLPANL